METLEKIKKLTFASACKLRKLDAKKVVPDFAHLPEEDREGMQSHTMIVIMVAAANQIANDGKPWKADYSDSNWKYEARWYNKGGSSGFRYIGYGGWHSGSTVGSRLAFISYDCMRALCEQNKNYIKLWNKYSPVK
ncbi:MAG TPA: hypothetical protein VGK59_23815 [Ohtaekwangia sp.]